MKKTGTSVAVFALLLAGCSVPFDITTEPQIIEIPNTAGFYVERVIPVPDEARDAKVTFTEVELHYTVRKNEAYAALLNIYASSDQAADHLKNAADEKTVEAALLFSDIEKTDTAVSPKIRDILNARQPQFVIGVENLSLNPVSSLSIEVRVRIKGSYSLR